MKHIFTIWFLIGFLFSSTAQDSLVIQGVKYRIDTLIHTHDIGLGTKHTYFRLPDLPLLVNTLEIDAQNPYLKFMSCMSNDSTRGLERPSAMALRNSSPGHVAFAVINADFYTTTGDDTGLPVNGQMLGGQVSKVPSASRPVIAFDHSKIPFLDVMKFSGQLKFGESSILINNVNTSRGSNQLILYNSFHGKTTKTNAYGTEVVVSLKDGNWEVNQSVRCIVEEVRVGVGSASIPLNKAVLSGHGTAQTFLNGLSVGSEIELDLKMSQNSYPTSFPNLVEMVGGDRIILMNGEIQNNDWVELHPRTSMGYSNDNSKVIMMVVDGRSENSKGVSTKQLAELMRHSGAANAINLDGGGSSVMVVHNKVCNTPADGSERRVANAMMVVSTAPSGTISSIQLNADYISVPYGKKFQLKTSTFNEHGAVVSYLNATGVNYTVTGNIGSVDATGLYTASGNEASGYITAELNGMTDVVHIKLIPAQSIRFLPDEITIDHLRNFKFKVYGRDLNNISYLMDNELVKFQSLEPTIGTVSNAGDFKGLKNGKVGIRVFTEVGNLADTCWVNVEIGRNSMLIEDFSDPGSFVVTKSWLDNVTLTREVHPEYQEEMLKVAYTLTYANRTAYVNLAKTIPVFGIPDSIKMEAVSNGYKSSFMYLLNHPMGACLVPAFTDNQLGSYRSAIQNSQFLIEDYPMPITNLRLTIERDTRYQIGTVYNGAFYLKSLQAVYPEKDFGTGKNPVTAKRDSELFPNPSSGEVSFTLSEHFEGNGFLIVYNLSGEKVFEKAFTGISGQSITTNLSNLPNGVYVYNLSNGLNRKSGKLVISK
jgi:hypothetical protein